MFIPVPIPIYLLKSTIIDVWLGPKCASEAILQMYSLQRMKWVNCFWYFMKLSSEATTGGVLLKKVFLKISRNSQEDTGARVSFLIKLQEAPVTLLIEGLCHSCFSVNFKKFLRTLYFRENLPWLLLIRLWTHYYAHCVKSVQTRSFFWSVFSRIRTEYGEIRSISKY